MSFGPDPENVKQNNNIVEKNEERGRTPSTATNATPETAGEGVTGFDAPSTGSVSLSNPEVGGPATPIYPPDGPADGTSKPGDDTIAS